MSDTVIVIGSASERLREEAVWRPDAERIGYGLADAAFRFREALEPEQEIAALLAALAARREPLLARLRADQPLPPNEEAHYFAYFLIPFETAILDAFRRRWAELGAAS